ncbi:MAG: hypothetical protein JNJ54_19105 [Myxococcaceae bacterium]|nr:hypothetical protein [Myxococcaceae bacterium]
MSTNELTSKSSERTPDAPLTYRTLDVEHEVRPFFAQELAREVRDGTEASECQLVYLGYSQEKDTFIAAYALSLRGRPAAQVLEIGWERKLFARSFKVRRGSRHADFGAQTEAAFRARFPDLTELARS